MKKFFLLFISSSFLLFACTKVKQVKDNKYLAYDKYKKEIEDRVHERQNKASLMSAYSGSNSWTSDASIPIPLVTFAYLCNSSQSPIGTGYIRYNLQIDIDNATKAYLSANKTTKRLELKFASLNDLPNVGWKAYTPTGLSAAADWPRCMYVDIPATDKLSMPDILITSIVPVNGISNYICKYWGTSIGWDGGFNFTTPPTYAISKGYTVDIYPGGYGTGPCM